MYAKMNIVNYFAAQFEFYESQPAPLELPMLNSRDCNVSNSSKPFKCLIQSNKKRRHLLWSARELRLSFVFLFKESYFCNQKAQTVA